MLNKVIKVDIFEVEVWTNAPKTLFVAGDKWSTNMVHMVINVEKCYL